MGDCSEDCSPLLRCLAADGASNRCCRLASRSRCSRTTRIKSIRIYKIISKENMENIILLCGLCLN